MHACESTVPCPTVDLNIGTENEAVFKTCVATFYNLSLICVRPMHACESTVPCPTVDLNTGTDNEELLKSPFYVGMRHK